MAYGVKLDPAPIASGLSVRELVDRHLYAYNAARLREACQLFARKIAQPGVTVGLTLSGALTPTGLGTAAIVPLIRAGMVDWIVSTGANLYHDMHRSLGFELFGSTPFTNDVELRENKLIRIYEKENQQMYEQPLEKSQYPAALAFLLGTGSLKQSFKLTKLDPKKMGVEGGYVLLGEPKEATPAYQKMFLYIDGGTYQVRRVILLDAQRNRNRFDFLNPEVNAKPPQGEFAFTPPAGTQIIRP